MASAARAAHNFARGRLPSPAQRSALNAIHRCASDMARTAATARQMNEQRRAAGRQDHQQANAQAGQAQQNGAVASRQDLQANNNANRPLHQQRAAVSARTLAYSPVDSSTEPRRQFFIKLRIGPGLLQREAGSRFGGAPGCWCERGACVAPPVLGKMFAAIHF